MAKRVSVTTLNASTIDILNTIRANASLQYQELVPVVETKHDIPAVGEVLYGYPELANQFINALVTRIASVRIKSAIFNNAYAELKKGYLEFGETVEEVFVQIAKAREFSVENAEKVEFKRSLPDVRSAFHAMNWRVQYPITVQDEDLRTAFLDVNGVQDMIAKIVDSVTQAAEYDEYLLFKYLLIKAISHGHLYPVAVDASDMKNTAVAFRGASNQLTFMGKQFNESGVTTITSKDDQYIFMDSMFNAQYDVNVLAAAFNMDKADFSGKLKLIDDWKTFDNDRFAEIVANSDMIEEVTAEELALMDNVICVLADQEWFQVYDNLYKMTEKYVASGMYWNYFLNIWKTVSHSPFSNAIVFVKSAEEIPMPETVTLKITDKSTDDYNTVLTLEPVESVDYVGAGINHVQNADMTEQGIAVHRYGAYIIPTGKSGTPTIRLGTTEYTTETELSGESEVGDTVNFTGA